MKAFIPSLVIAAASLLSAGSAHARGPGLVFTGADNSYASFNCAGFPAGNSARTLEAWLRVPVSTGPLNGRGSVVELGQQADTGSAFGLQVEGNRVGFWGHNADQRAVVELPDDQWHHVALTYADQRVTIYLDGVFKGRWTNRPLATSVGTCHIGAYPARQWYLRGSVGGIKVWSGVRTAEQILDDMAGAPRITGSEPGLVAAIDLSEGQGTTFADVNRRLSGTLQAGASWNQPLPTNPQVATEGVWFVVQSKAELATDLAIPARRTALTWNDQGNAVMAPVPLTGNTCAGKSQADRCHDQFLWRVQPVPGGGVKLVNKARGDGLALDCGAASPQVLAAGGIKQGWQLVAADRARWGTNAYTFACSGQRMAYRGGKVAMEAAAAAPAAEQAWVLQPMDTVLGWRLPANPAADDHPWGKVLALDRGQTLKGTDTVSDWAMLNAHNIYTNMLTALGDPQLQAAPGARKVFLLFGRHDYLPCKYPGIMGDCGRVNEIRGYSGDETVITEEMMGRTGVYSRGPKDTAYREFEQVVHEFAHTLNYKFFAAKKIDQFADAGGNVEWYPWMVQYWFNSAQSAGQNKSRATLQATTADYLATMFSRANDWLPPRLLRAVTEPLPNFVVSGTLLPVGAELRSPATGSFALKLQQDGNMVVTATRDGAFRWGTFNNLNAPMTGVKGVVYLNGNLYFTTLASTGPLADLLTRITGGKPTPEVLSKIQLHPADASKSYRLHVNDDPDATGNYLRVVDLDGWKTVWTSRR